MSRSNHFYWNSEDWHFVDTSAGARVLEHFVTKPHRRIEGRRSWTRKPRYPQYGTRSQGPPPQSVYVVWRRQVRAQMKAEMDRNPLDPMIHKDSCYFDFCKWY